MVALFGLIHTIKYKARSGRATGARCAAFEQLLRHVEGLADAIPALEVTTSTCVRRSMNGASGTALDRAEDEIDACECAYVAHYYWTHSTARCRVVGDLDTGYIVTPVTPTLADCPPRRSSSLLGALVLIALQWLGW